MKGTELSAYFRREATIVQPAALRFRLGRVLHPRLWRVLGFEIARICLDDYNYRSIGRAAEWIIPTRSVSEGQFRRSLTCVSGYD